MYAHTFLACSLTHKNDDWAANKTTTQLLLVGMMGAGIIVHGWQCVSVVSEASGAERRGLPDVLITMHSA